MLDLFCNKLDNDTEPMRHHSSASISSTNLTHIISCARGALAQISITLYEKLITFFSPKNELHIILSFFAVLQYLLQYLDYFYHIIIHEKCEINNYYCSLFRRAGMLCLTVISAQII